MENFCHEKHAEVWEAVSGNCTSVAVGHSRESIGKKLTELGYKTPSFGGFGSRWENEEGSYCIVIHSQAYHPVKNECWVCNRLAIEEAKARSEGTDNSEG